MFQTKEYRKETFTVSTDRSKVDLNKVCDFLARSYWANNRKRETIMKSIEHSLCLMEINKSALPASLPIGLYLPIYAMCLSMKIIEEKNLVHGYYNVY